MTPDFSGNWKIILCTPGQKITVLLVRFENKDEKVEAKILSTFPVPEFAEAKLLSVRKEGAGLHLVVQARGKDFSFNAYAPKEDPKPSKLLGSLGILGQREFVVLERTDAEKLDTNPKNLVVKEDEAGELEKALNSTSDKARQESLEAIWKKHPEGSLGHLVGMQLLFSKVRDDAAEDEIKPLLQELTKQSRSFGPEMELSTERDLAAILLNQKGYSALALAEARKARALLTEFTPAEQQSAVLKILASALRRNGKADEAKGLRASLDKVEAILDEQYLKNAIPFKPEKTTPPKSKGDRVALVELFTGAECPPCVAADVAFDALLESFTDSEVILLQYHLHVPGPDPLTNPDSETRSEYYRVEGTPAYYIDGKGGPPAGGPKQNSEHAYRSLIKKIEDARVTKSEAKLGLRAEKGDDKINIHADVSNLDEPGDSMRLRIALVEDVVRYAGSNGQRFHHRIVRGFPGGVAGTPVKDKALQKTVSISIADVRKTLQDYLAKHHFDEETRPLNLASLKVVAFIQDDKTNEILQAASVDLPKLNGEKQ